MYFASKLGRNFNVNSYSNLTIYGVSMTFIKDQQKYRQALLMRDAGILVVAQLFLRAAYGVAP